MIHGSSWAPNPRRAGPGRKLTSLVIQKSMNDVDRYPLAMRVELVSFLREEWDLQINKMSVSTILKRERQSKRRARALSDRQNPRLR